MGHKTIVYTTSTSRPGNITTRHTHSHPHTHTHTHSPHMHTASIPYSEWKETIHLKQQDSQPSEQQDESDKESEEDDKIEEKPIRRRSGRKTYQNQLRQNEVHQKDQADTGESNKISATDEEVYELGSYEDRLRQ